MTFKIAAAAGGDEAIDLKCSPPLCPTWSAAVVFENFVFKFNFLSLSWENLFWEGEYFYLFIWNSSDELLANRCSFLFCTVFCWKQSNWPPNLSPWPHLLSHNWKVYFLLSFSLLKRFPKILYDFSHFIWMFFLSWVTLSL